MSLEIQEGDIIMFDKEPYVLDDEGLLKLVLIYREDPNMIGEIFIYNNQAYVIKQYIKGKTLSKTLVEKLKG